MNFNIELERTITEEQVPAINEIMELAKGLLDLDALEKWMDSYPSIKEGVYYGGTGTHIWVSDKKSLERILLITQK